MAFLLLSLGWLSVQALAVCDHPSQAEFPNIGCKFPGSAICGCEDTGDGETCSYICEPGYEKTGDTTITCSKLSSGAFVWELGTAQCAPAQCTGRPAIAYMDTANSCSIPVPSGSSCEYACLDQRTKNGEAMVCDKGEWTGTLPTCTGCPFNPTISNIDASSPCSNTVDGGTCAFLCNPGYSASGVATCTGSDWTAGPTCDPDPCAANPVITGLDGSTACGGTASGASCALTCTTGVSGVTATCMAGSWIGASCQPGACLGEPNITGIDSSCAGADDAATCTFSCAQGLSPSGPATCSSGSWTEGPTCDPVPCTETGYRGVAGNCECAAGYFGTVSYTAAGELSGCSPCATGYWSIAGNGVTCAPIQCTGQGWAPGYKGTPGNCQCDDGYTGPVEYVNGAVSGCVPDNCNTNPSFAHVSDSSPCNPTAHGASCAYLCDAGWTPSGNATCSAGTWSTAQEACIPVDCGTPSEANHVFSLVTPGVTGVGSAASYTCAQGYAGTAGQVTCQSSGQWSTAAACTPIVCLAPTTPGYLIILQDDVLLQSNFPGAVTAVCAFGYYGSPVASACTANGTTFTWSGTACQKITCTSPDPLPAGVVENITSLVFDSFAVELSCGEGYTSSGNAPTASRCNENGKPYTLPVDPRDNCEPILCSDPGVTGYAVNANASAAELAWVSFSPVVTCADGFVATSAGPSATRCNATGGAFGVTGCEAPCGALSLPDGLTAMDFAEDASFSTDCVDEDGVVRLSALSNRSCVVAVSNLYSCELNGSAIEQVVLNCSSDATPGQNVTGLENLECVTAQLGAAKTLAPPLVTEILLLLISLVTFNC